MTTTATPPAFDDMSRTELLAIVERYHAMLAELAAIAPGSGEEVELRYYVVDDVTPDADGTFRTFWGTSYSPDALTLARHARGGHGYDPYIIGEV